MKKVVLTSLILLVFSSNTTVNSNRPFLKKAVYEMVEALRFNDEVGIRKYFYVGSKPQSTNEVKAEILEFCALDENQFNAFNLIGVAIYEIPYLKQNFVEILFESKNKVYVLKFGIDDNYKFHFINQYEVFSNYNAIYPNQYVYEDTKKINLVEVFKYSKWTFSKTPSNQNELIEQGKKLFSEKTCIACHLPDGSGLIGPNHTDNYWLFGNTYDDVFHTIAYGGRKGKGMVAWGNTISEEDRMKLTYYVLSLHNNPIKGKSPEGELYEN